MLPCTDIISDIIGKNTKMESLCVGEVCVFTSCTDIPSRNCVGLMTSNYIELQFREIVCMLHTLVLVLSLIYCYYKS